MDSAVEILKLVGPAVWKNIKYLMKPNSFLREWKEMKDRLRGLCNDIEHELNLQSEGIGKVVEEEVAHCLEKMKYAADYDEDATVEKGGCFCNICLAKHLDERTLEMKSLLEEWKMFFQDRATLVRDDYSIIVDHLTSEFQKMFKSLQRLKKDTESTLRSQLQYGKIVKEEVNFWLENVNRKLETAQDEVSGSRSLPPTRIAELVEEKNGELKKLLDEGEEFVFGNAILVMDDPSLIKGVPLPSDNQYGRDAEMKRILECLKRDEVTRMAVCGREGIGKSTLMKHVNNALLEESTFQKILWVTLLESLNVFHVQNEIASQLTREALEEEDPTRRAATISRMLLHGRILLILDNVAEEFPIDEVGIPSDSESGASRFKLVLITRLKSVARLMDCEIVSELKPLSFEVSLQLFLDMVGRAVLSDDGGNINPVLESTLLQIVKECEGLPLDIVKIARTMQGKSDQYSWQNALQQLQRERGEQDPVGFTLKSKYDSLENKKLQHCFLYCALYPEGFEIPKEELLEYWIEEGYIDQMPTRHMMIVEGHEILRKLQNKSLLEYINHGTDQNAVETHGILGLNFESVKMDGRPRSMALEITSARPHFLVKASLSEEELQEEEEWAKDVEKVSLMRNGMEEIPLAKTHLKSYNMLTTLLMPNNRIETIPESFFVQMPELKILDLSWNRKLKSLPESTSNLENLTTLLLQACGNLTKVPSLSKCQRLTKLDLSWAGIEQLPEGMDMLENLKYLDLRAPRIRKIPQGLLPKLFNLQHLYVMEMEAEEVVTLSKLEYIQGTAGSSDGMRIFLTFMLHQAEWIASISSEVEEPSLALFLDTDMEGNLVLFVNGKFILADLYTSVGGDEDRDLSCINRVLANDALSLRVLSIQALENIECVFCSAFNPLQTLTLLRLVELDNLESVFDENCLGLSASPPAASYSALPLNSIVVKDCPALKNLFPFALLLGYLQNLQHIEVTDCKEMEEIIASTTSEEEKLNLPQLRTLKLNDLPALKSICSSNCVLICDSLETLEIRDCENLKKISLYFSQLDDDAYTTAPLSLKTITVDSEEWWKASEWCHPNATGILLPKCVFSYDDYDEVLEELTLPKLKTLQLNDLPAWKGIRSSSSVLSCDSSKTFEIRDCRKMKRKSSFVSSPT